MQKKPRREEKSYESSSSSSSSYPDNAPDGGWGWMVCFGSFLINFIIDGTMFSFGILLLELLTYFGEGKAKTAWIGSAQLGMSMVMGPLVSVLLERFTCRQITIGGSILSVGALVLSTFSPSVNVLILTYGFITGIGFSMAFISAIIVVGLNFNKKRAIATGIATSGSGLGTFAYAYLTNYLLNNYDWRGTVLILAGILSNCVVCGAIFRPLTSKIKSRSTSDVSTCDSFAPKVFYDDEVKQPLHIRPVIDKANFLSKGIESHELARSTDLTVFQNKSDRVTNTQKLFSSHMDVRDLKRHEKQQIFNPMSKKDIFYSGSLARLSHVHDHTETGSSDTGTGSSEASLAVEAGGDHAAIRSLRWVRLWKAIKSNCVMFKDRTFLLLLVSNVLWTVQSVPLTYIPDLGVSKNLPKEQAALLISIVGFTNIIGRILSGVITDYFNVKSSITYTIALLLASLSNFLFPWCMSFTTLAICCSVFGLCMATAVSMRTIVLADHLGIERLTKAFGLVAFFQGAAFITNAPLAGFLYEQHQSYLIPFTFAGSCYFMSGISCLAVHLCSNSRQFDGSRNQEYIVADDTISGEEELCIPKTVTRKSDVKI